MDKRRSMSKSKKAVSANIVWFEIPVDKPERAKKFYHALFGWKISPFPGMTDFWHIDTGGGAAAPAGALMVRKESEQRIRNFVNVISVTKSMAKVKKLGGKVCLPKTAVKGMGYFAVCRDTENNAIGFWEINKKAK
jgi:uncharacterized protein